MGCCESRESTGGGPRRPKPEGWGPEYADSDGCTALWLSAKDGDVGEVESLLLKKADASRADNHNDTPLHAAACNGHVDVIRQLVAASADVNAAGRMGMTPLCAAADQLGVAKSAAETCQVGGGFVGVCAVMCKYISWLPASK